MIRPLLVGLVCVVPVLQLGRDLPLAFGPPVEVPAQAALPAQILPEAEREGLRAAWRGDDKGPYNSPAGLAREMTRQARRINEAEQSILEQKPFDQTLLKDRGLARVLSQLKSGVDNNRVRYEELTKLYSNDSLRVCAKKAVAERGAALAGATAEAKTAVAALDEFKVIAQLPASMRKHAESLGTAWGRLADALTALRKAAPGELRLRKLHALAQAVPNIPGLARRAGAELADWLPKQLPGDGMVRLVDSTGSAEQRLAFPADKVHWLPKDRSILKGEEKTFGLPLGPVPSLFQKGGEKADKVDYYLPPGRKAGEVTRWTGLELSPSGRAARFYDVRRAEAVDAGWKFSQVKALCPDKLKEEKDQEAVSHLAKIKELVALQDVLKDLGDGARLLFPE